MCSSCKSHKMQACATQSTNSTLVMCNCAYKFLQQFNKLGNRHHRVPVHYATFLAPQVIATG